MLGRSLGLLVGSIPTPYDSRPDDSRAGDEDAAVMDSWSAAYCPEMGMGSFGKIDRGILIAFMGRQLAVVFMYSRRRVSRRVKGWAKYVRRRQFFLWKVCDRCLETRETCPAHGRCNLPISPRGCPSLTERIHRGTPFGASFRKSTFRQPLLEEWKNASRRSASRKSPPNNPT